MDGDSKRGCDVLLIEYIYRKPILTNRACSGLGRGLGGDARDQDKSLNDDRGIRKQIVVTYVT